VLGEELEGWTVGYGVELGKANFSASEMSVGQGGRLVGPVPNGMGLSGGAGQVGRGAGIESGQVWLFGARDPRDAWWGVCQL
jgi:hypothetical protein